MRIRFAAIPWLLFGLAAQAGAADGEPNQATRETMGEIFESVRFVLPLSLNDERFEDPEVRAAVLDALTTLADDGSRLEAHSRRRDAGFVFLSRSLARDAAEIRRRYVEGETVEARFLFHRLIDTCVACHSRLPSQRESRLGRRLLEDARVAELPLDQRAKLEVATRQFDRALATHEALFASPEYSPAALDLMGHFDDYLEVSIRVRRDPERPIPVLEKFSKRSDISGPLRGHLRAWTRSLGEIHGRGLEPASLERARGLLAQAEDRERFADERSALVHYIAASSVLHRYVDSHPRNGPGVGEAYYLLGVIESRVGHAFWLSQTEFLLETAIRTAPGEPYAERAYELLEEFVVSGYTGSGGGQVPTDVRERLDALRRLLDRARAPGA